MLPSKARKGEGNGRHMKTEQGGRLKLVEIVLLLFLAAFLATGAMALQTGQELSDKVVRLHVLANSDSEEDQALKLKVRDRILAYAEPLLAGAADRYVKKGGIFITSGIIDTKEEDVKAAFAANPAWELLEVTRQKDWVSVTVRKR